MDSVLSKRTDNAAINIFKTAFLTHFGVCAINFTTVKSHKEGTTVFIHVHRL